MIRRRGFLKGVAIAGAGLVVRSRFGVPSARAAVLPPRYFLRKWIQPLRGLTALGDSHGIPCASGVPDPAFSGATFYQITAGERTETQSSSGLIVATGLGSTAWFKSIVTGALAIAGAYGSTSAPVPYAPSAWDCGELRFAVREPFPSLRSQTSLVCGRLTPSEPLLIRSLMPETGVIFSDGIEADRLDFNSGAEAQITVAERQGRLVV